MAKATKMTKSQLMQELSAKTDLTKKQVAMFFDALAALAYTQVKKGNDFVLPGFGKMVKVNRAARQGRNPLTGATIQIPAKTVVKFRLASAAKKAVL